jgi:phage terminase large subunit-like protein
MLAFHGLPVKPLYPHADKVTRATNAMLLAEKGRIWLPQSTLGLPWLKDIEEELFIWTGHVQQADDIVDTLSYAGLDLAAEVVSIAHDGDFALGDEIEQTILNDGPFVIPMS